MAKERDTRRDLAGVGPDPAESRRRLISIDDLDGYKVASGEPDIRGWDVATLNGRELGSVEDLLVDPERGEVVMIEVALRGDQLHAEVPLRSVQLDRKRNVVVVDSGDIEGARHDMRARDRMDDDDRERLRGAYGGTARDVRYEDRAERNADEQESVRLRQAEEQRMREEEEQQRQREEEDRRRREEEERRARQAAEQPTGERHRNDDVEETVVERRPVIEEVVVRRRVIEE